MPGENLADWSTTAANNATADSSINLAEGQTRASINDSMRSAQAAHAKDRNLKNGSITTGGTANAQTFTSGVSYTAVPTGLRVMLKIGVTNTDSTTLNMDAIGGVTIKNLYGLSLGGGELQLGAYAGFLFDGTNWILLQESGPVLLAKQTASASATIDFTSGISSAFNEYQLHFSGVVPATSANAMMLRVSTDAGATFKTGASDYKWAIAVFSDVAPTPSSQSGDTADTQMMLINGALGNDATLGGVNGTVSFFKPSSTSANVHFVGEYSSVNATAGLSRWASVGAYVMAGSSVNAVRVMVSSGAISTGSFALYGVR